MWDRRKYILIATVIQITNVVVSKKFYCVSPKSPFTLVS